MSACIGRYIFLWVNQCGYAAISLNWAFVLAVIGQASWLKFISFFRWGLWLKMKCSKCSELVNERVSFPKLTFFMSSIYFSWYWNCDWLIFFCVCVCVNLFVQFGLMIRCNFEMLEHLPCNLYEDTVWFILVFSPLFISWQRSVPMFVCSSQNSVYLNLLTLIAGWLYFLTFIL